jgi:hypothetical protein
MVGNEVPPLQHPEAFWSGSSADLLICSTVTALSSFRPAPRFRVLPAGAQSAKHERARLGHGGEFTLPGSGGHSCSLGYFYRAK